MTPLHIMQAKPGEEVHQFARRMVVEAYTRNCTVLGEHNQHTLHASPGMTSEDVLMPWNEAQRRSYMER